MSKQLELMFKPPHSINSVQPSTLFFLVWNPTLGTRACTRPACCFGWKHPPLDIDFVTGYFRSEMVVGRGSRRKPASLVGGMAWEGGAQVGVYGSAEAG